jgi:transposase
MITSIQNNRLAVKLALDPFYKVQKNGIIKKKGADGKYRTLHGERHGYRIVVYKGKKLVVGRVVYAQRLLETGLSAKEVSERLGKIVVERKNGVSLDDRLNNLAGKSPGKVRRGKMKRLSKEQIELMVKLFRSGHSVAKIARRFRRKISRSHLSRIIKRELGVSK